MNQSSRVFLGEPVDPGFKQLLLRGLLGGAAGGFIWVAGGIWMSFDKLHSNWLEWLMVSYLVMGLPIGAFVGGAAAIVIWTIHSNWAADLGPCARFASGTIVAMTLWAVLWALTPTKGFVPISWESIVVNLVYFSVTLGGLSGLISGRQRS